MDNLLTYPQQDIIFQDLRDILVEQKEMNLVKMLGCQIFQDGNQFICILGEMPERYIAGWGDSAYLAVLDFNKKFYNR